MRLPGGDINWLARWLTLYEKKNRKKTLIAARYRRWSASMSRARIERRPVATRALIRYGPRPRQLPHRRSRSRSSLQGCPEVVGLRFAQRSHIAAGLARQVRARALPDACFRAN